MNARHLFALLLLATVAGCKDPPPEPDRQAAFNEILAPIAERADRPVKYLEQVAKDRADAFTTAGKWMRVENFYELEHELLRPDPGLPPDKAVIRLQRTSRFYQDPKRDHSAVGVTAHDVWFDTEEEAMQARQWSTTGMTRVKIEYTWQDGAWVRTGGWDFFPANDNFDELDVYEKVEGDTWRDPQVGTIRKLL